MKEGGSMAKTYQTRNVKLMQNVKKQEDESESKNDVIFWNVLFRILLFTLALFIIICIGKFHKTSFDSFQNAYKERMNHEYSIEKIQETVSKLSKSVFHTIPNAGGEDIPFLGKKATFAPVYPTLEFVCPVAYSRVSSNFGYRENPITHKRGFHTGLDLAAPMHTPIFAAFSGEVVKADISPARGKYIELAHGAGLSTIYCHCDTILCKAGDVVSAGTCIGKVGQTGQATGPHLHFEIRKNGIAHSPKWLWEFYGLSL